MEALKIFERKDVPMAWDYDGDADTLYFSFGRPRRAVGIDLGDGVILRFDEKAREVVGLTIVGVASRLKAFVKDKRPRRRSSLAARRPARSATGA